MLEKLESVLYLWKKTNNYDWERIEDMFNIRFPIDYKLFINNYGEGGINELFVEFCLCSLNMKI